MYQALATGLLFARFARPTASILFSRSAIVAPYAGGRSLQFRIAIRRRIWVPSLLADSAVSAGLANRAPLAPKPQVQGEPVAVPVRYRRASRIRTTGLSQTGPRWRY